MVTVVVTLVNVTAVITVTSAITVHVITAVLSDSGNRCVGLFTIFLVWKTIVRSSRLCVRVCKRVNVCVVMSVCLRVEDGPWPLHAYIYNTLCV